MTFRSNHYVPVLKIKRGEKDALRAIPASLSAGITPLLEVVERVDGKTVAKHIDTAFKGLQESTRLYPRCLVDAKALAPDGETAAHEVFNRASADGMVFTPVTGMSRSVDVDPALLHSNNGIAIRLTVEEFESGGLAYRLSKFVETHKLSPTQVDLIVDLGPVDKLIYDGVQLLASSFLSAVPDHSLWRTLTLSGCAFPQTMGGVKSASHDLVERNEWRTWRDHLYANRRTLARLPTYSDCGIQHSKGVEGFDFRTMQASAAIRYTLDENWLLIKGRGTRTNPAKIQFPGLAKSLVYGRHATNYAGASHCTGCTDMKAAAHGVPKLGSPEVWRRLGTIHHIMTVVRALTALPWP